MLSRPSESQNSPEDIFTNFCEEHIRANPTDFPVDLENFGETFKSFSEKLEIEYNHFMLDQEIAAPWKVFLLRPKNWELL